MFRPTRSTSDIVLIPVITSVELTPPDWPSGMFLGTSVDMLWTWHTGVLVGPGVSVGVSTGTLTGPSAISRSGESVRARSPALLAAPAKIELVARAAPTPTSKASAADRNMRPKLFSQARRDNILCLPVLCQAGARGHA